MLIKCIEISNFLCYYGSNNRFDFVEGLNIILGANGYGKSKLYDAFQWGFNDGITDSSPRQTATSVRSTSVVKRELISEKALFECAVGEGVEAKVVIEVVDNQQKEFQLIRSYQIKRRDESTWIEPARSDFRILYKDVLEFKPVWESEYDATLERLIPVDVRPYVWFQGERGISNLIDTSNTESLRNVIKRLSDIDRWDKYIETTTTAARTAQTKFDQELSKSKRNESKILELQTKRRNAASEIQRLDTLLTTVSNNLHAAQLNHEELSADIEYAEKMNSIVREKEQIEKDYKIAKEREEQLTEGLSNKLFTNYWVLSDTTFLIDKFEKKFKDYNTAVFERIGLANLSKKIEEQLQNRLPKGVPEPLYVKQMLEQQHCLVCNRPAEEGTDAYNEIAKLLIVESSNKIEEEKPRTDLQSFFGQVYGYGLSLRDSINRVDESIQEAFYEINEARALVSALDLELKQKDRQLQEQLQLSGITNARDIVNSMKNALADVKKYTEEQSKLSSRKQEFDNQIKGIDKDLSNLSEGEVPEYLRQKKDMLQDLSALAKQVKRRKYQELVKLLEDTANDHYRNINAPTGAFYGTIKFVETSGDAYRPAVVDADNREVNNLNTSLVSSLKLSIIMAVVSANKMRDYPSLYPLISDAPVSDFDVVKIRTFFIETASTFKQSIVIMKELLVKDDERSGRYKPDSKQLQELRNEIEALNRPLKVYQLDMPDGVTNKFRSELEVSIKLLF
ncbi:hypothetical protein [Spirosoma pomorum]